MLILVYPLDKLISVFFCYLHLYHLFQPFLFILPLLLSLYFCFLTLTRVVYYRSLLAFFLSCHYLQLFFIAVSINYLCSAFSSLSHPLGVSANYQSCSFSSLHPQHPLLSCPPYAIFALSLFFLLIHLSWVSYQPYISSS